jgi:hypothetical protein
VPHDLLVVVETRGRRCIFKDREKEMKFGQVVMALLVESASTK